MTFPLEVKVRDRLLSAGAMEEIRERAEKLHHFYDRIHRCRVTVEGPGRHHRRGVNRVRIDLRVPGAEIVVSRQKGDNFTEAVREAFSAAGRRLEDYVRKRRGFVKTPSVAPRGRVSVLFPARGYGFLEDESGREVYFHRNSVANRGFGRLKVGSVVRFHEEMGELGPRATNVRPVRGRIARAAGA